MDGRKRSALVIFGGCSLVVLLSWSLFVAPTRAGSRKPVPQKVKGKVPGTTVHAIYHHWFTRPYEYMFDRNKTVLSVRGRNYGRFMAGIDGIVLYGGVASAAAKHLKLKGRHRFYDLKPIEKLSGHKVYLRKSNSHRTFSRFNPKLIRWGHRNLIPAPQDRLQGHTFQTIYDAIFSRFFRLMADSYLFLHHKRSVKQEARAYLRAMKRRKFAGIAYLQNRYRGDLQAYSCQQDGTNFTPQMAVGFWIRRSVDRTDRELYAGLQRVMTLYDGVWWTARLKAIGAGKQKPGKRKPRRKKSRGR